MFKEDINYPANTVTYIITAPAVKLPLPQPGVEIKKKDAPLKTRDKGNTKGHFLCGNELCVEYL